MKKALQGVLAILSLIPLFFATTGIWRGAALHVPAEHVTPALDNAFRYNSGFYLVLFFLLWWMIPKIDTKALRIPFRLVTLAIFIGGLARVISYMAYGTPPPQMMAGMFLELGAPLLALWQTKLSKG